MTSLMWSLSLSLIFFWGERKTIKLPQLNDPASTFDRRAQEAGSDWTGCAIICHTRERQRTTDWEDCTGRGRGTTDELNRGGGASAECSTARTDGRTPRSGRRASDCFNLASQHFVLESGEKARPEKNTYINPYCVNSATATVIRPFLLINMNAECATKIWSNMRGVNSPKSNIRSENAT